MVEKIEKAVFRTSDGREFDTRKNALAHEVYLVLLSGVPEDQRDTVDDDYDIHGALSRAKDLISLLRQYVEAGDEQG